MLFSIVLALNNEILAVYYSKRSDIKTLYGKVELIKDGNKLILCLAKCTINVCHCKGILFNKNQSKNQRCQHISYGSNTIDLGEFPGFLHYSQDKTQEKICIDLRMAVNFKDYNIPCPRLYFPLDNNQTGNAMAGKGAGASVENVQFVSEAKFGKALYNPTTDGELKSYYHLGIYPRAEFCFPFPDTCPEGMSISFWLKIRSDTGQVQGLITTMKSNGPGFAVYFTNNGGLYFR